MKDKNSKNIYTYNGCVVDLEKVSLACLYSVRKKIQELSVKDDYNNIEKNTNYKYYNGMKVSNTNKTR